MPVAEDVVRQFASSLKGELIREGDAAYQVARKIWNAMIDRRPAMIVRCWGTYDVVNAVNFARYHGIQLSVRGGGHNVSGNAVCDGGLVIDLSTMKEIRVDPERRVAFAQGGVTWGELDAKTQEHGLATTGGIVSSTGIAGLTLGGGLGWLMRKHGLTCDSLLGAEIVTADGRILRADARENSDLFWAVRGGGGNFGVVTSFEYQLHPVGKILGGPLIHPFERAQEVLRFFRKFTEGAPDELMAFAALTHSPQGARVALLLVAYFGEIEDGERVLRPLREFGPPLVDQVGPIAYTNLQRILDPAYGPGARNYWKSNFLTDLSDEAIRTIVQHYAEFDSPQSDVVIELGGGAVGRVGKEETAYDHREGHLNFEILARWTDPSEDEANRAWARRFWEAMQPFSTGRVYVNYLGEEREEGFERIKSAYGPDKYERLVALKRKYDPENLFRFNQNIKPGG